MPSLSRIHRRNGIVYMTCRICGKDKPLPEISQNGKYSKKYPRYNDYCKECEALYKRMGLSLKNNQENKYDAQAVHFIYNAF